MCFRWMDRDNISKRNGSRRLIRFTTLKSILPGPLTRTVLGNGEESSAKERPVSLTTYLRESHMWTTSQDLTLGTLWCLCIGFTDGWWVPMDCHQGFTESFCKCELVLSKWTPWNLKRVSASYHLLSIHKSAILWSVAGGHQRHLFFALFVNFIVAPFFILAVIVLIKWF